MKGGGLSASFFLCKTTKGWNERERGRGENYAGGSNEITVKFGEKHNLGIYDPTTGTDVVQTVKKSDKISLTMTDKPYIIQLKK